MTTLEKLADHKQYASPLRLLIIIAASVFITEAGVMILFFILPPMHHVVAAPLDATLVTILIYPILYRYVVRPMRRHIDERRQAEAALSRAYDELESRVRERTADLKRAQAVAHTGSWRLDVRRNELRWSDETYRMFGIPRGTPLTYETFLAAVHPDDRAYVDQQWTAALRGEPYDIEHRIVVGNVERWVRERAELEFDQQGTLLGGFGIAHDITERKRAEETMAWLASFPKFNPLPVVEVDLAGHVEYLNPAAQRLLPDLAALSLQHPWLVELKSVGKQFQLNGAKVVTREITIGEAIYQQTLHFVSNYQRIRIYGLDITERKRAEGTLQEVNEVLEAKVEARTAELTRMYEALRRSEQQLRSIIDNSTDGITLVDENGIILEWNHGQESITGLPRDKVIGCPLWDVIVRITVPEHRSPERYEQLKALALQGINSGQIPAMHQSPERTIVRPDGTRRIVQPMPSSVKTDKGYMTVSITRDVTEPKQAEQALKRLNRALRMLSECSVAQIHAADESGLLAEICRLIVETGGYRMAWVGLADQDPARSVRPVAQYGFEEGYLDQAQITWADTERGRGPTGTTIRTGVAQVIQDSMTNPRMAPWREAALIRGYQSSIALPLKDEESTFGALTIHSSSPNAFDEEEVDRLTKLANDLAFGINALRARAERQRAEKRLRLQIAAMEAAANGIVIADRQGKIQWTNPAVTRLSGYATHEVLGQSTRIFRSGQHDADFYHRMWTTILSGQVWRGEMVNRRKDGSLYMEEQTITPVWGEEDTITHFIAIKQDITDRKRAENVIRLNAARAEALSEVSRALVEASLDYQTVLDAVAHGASRMLGGACAIYLLSEDEHWLNLATINHADPDIARALQQILAVDPFNVQEGLAAQSLATGRPLLMPSVPAAQLGDLFKLNIDALEKLATTISLVSVPLRLYGKLIGAVTVWRDQPGSLLTADDQLALQRLADRAALAIDNAQLYTALQQSLQKEQNMRQQLVQAETFAAMGRIVAAVAHELNNPLQTIRNCLFLIQQEIQPDGLMHEYFQMAATEFERLTNLVAQLRTLQRARVTTVMQPLDLCSLIDHVHGLLEAELTAHRIRWQSSIETSHRTIVGVFDQLKQVCLNIGLNALEAMQACGGTLSVDMIASDTGEQVGVRFRDTGPGIKPENLVKVFEPLFTTKPNGLGLGLAICYEIVQRHNGHIAVESEPGHGATFTVWLPPADQGQAEHGHESTSQYEVMSA